ncbi:MAG: SGNH/GDSL hydrolase family protein [Lachnospiraceae bacterium]|nr:SGNH/GDSL hydrolase family protein [Lachnospiraceae bacterium]
MKRRASVWIAALAASVAVLWCLERLLMPKYMGKVIEGNLTEEYYKETTGHDVLILGNCEAYENISPLVLWREFGITSYIRGNAQQLIAQSYYLLEDTLRTETPKAVILNISSMTQFEQDNESYNRMTLDGMRWSSAKWQAVLATKMEGEHMIEYIFPLLRFHSRWKELEREDFAYFFKKESVSHNGYYMRADIRPAGELPAMRRRSDYSFDPRAWEYLDKLRLLCEEKGITLILMKAPALYPYWYEEWDSQIVSYAKTHELAYLNCSRESEAIGIDFSQDTYDQGIHLNVYGAEKLARYLGTVLSSVPGVEDRRQDTELAAVWAKKEALYDEEKAKQEAEFARLGYLTQFYTDDDE